MRFKTFKTKVFAYIGVWKSGGPLSLVARWKLKLAGHSHQFSQRSGLHLAHNVSSMDLHGDFAGPEIRGYLFIEHPGNHKTHDLALACGQRLVTFSQLSKLGLPLPRYAVTIQGLIDRIQQVLVTEGLGQELHGAGFHGSHRHRDVPMGGYKDYWNLNARVGQLVLKVQTVYPRKSHIQNQATWLVRSLVA